MATILVVDDETSIREVLQIALEEDGHQILLAGGTREAGDLLDQNEVDLVVTDLKLPDGSGLDVLARTGELQPDAQVIVITAHATAETALAAMRQGAYDYLIKPFPLEEMRILVTRALEKYELLAKNRRLEEELKTHQATRRLQGKSPRMVALQRVIERAAPTRTTVLIEGESGTGKELVARAVHHMSRRSDGPFVPVNCGAIPANLIEAELFGHVAGAYTGAQGERDGLFLAASEGTLLLDEVSELPMDVQVKMLRVLQERKLRPVGGHQEIEVDVRIVAATNKPLEPLVEEGIFREDLFYRLNVLRVQVPPLRERREDIPALAETFVFRFAEEQGKNLSGVTEAALQALLRHRFPGNVRELQNWMERAVTMAQGDWIDLGDLPPELGEVSTDAADVPDVVPQEGLMLEEALRAYEYRLVQDALQRTNGVKTQAAKLLGLSFRSFRYRLEKLGID